MQVRSSAPGADTRGSIASAHAAIQPPDTGPHPARHLYELETVQVASVLAADDPVAQVVLGAEHLRELPPRSILAGTHHGFADVPLVRYGLARSPSRSLIGRLVVATGAMGFSTSSVFGKPGVLAFGLYPLHQHGEREASPRRLAQLADAGNLVLIFPRGTHARPEQELADEPSVRFRPGIAHLAAALDGTVVPFGLAGTERLIPPFVEQFHGRVLAGIPVSLRRAPLAIVFGPPLTRAPGEAPRAFAARLRAVGYALPRQAERAPAPAEDRP